MGKPKRGDGGIFSGGSILRMSITALMIVIILFAAGVPMMMAAVDRVNLSNLNYALDYWGDRGYVAYADPVGDLNVTGNLDVTGAVNADSINAPTGRTATYVIAASDAPAHVKAQADYVCDGIADEVEINEALALLTNGGCVQLSKGTFTVADKITLGASYLTLRGESFRTVITCGTNFNGTIIGADTTRDNYYCIIENLTVNGNGENQSVSGIGIDMTAMRSGTVQNCRITNTKTHGVFCDYAVRATKPIFITHNSIGQNLGDGIKLKGVYGFSIVDNYYIGNNGDDGIDLQSGGEGQVCNNSIDENGAYGIYCYAADRMLISDNKYIGDNGYSGIRIDSSATDYIISNNFILENGSTDLLANGIYLGGTVSRITITGNRIWDNSSGDQDYGIRIGETTNGIYIYNNDLQGNVVNAINRVAGSTDVIIKDNKGYIAPGEIRTYSGSIATLTENAINSLDNPFGQAVRVLDFNINVSTGATATTPDIDCGIGSSATTDYANLFDDLPGETIGFYRSTAGAPGTQTVPILWESGSGNRYLNMSIKDAAATGMVATYTVTVMGN